MLYYQGPRILCYASQHNKLMFCYHVNVIDSLRGGHTQINIS